MPGTTAVKGVKGSVSLKKGKKYTYYVRAYVKEPTGVVKSKYKAFKAVKKY